jgi:hypothetical protein
MPGKLFSYSEKNLISREKFLVCPENFFHFREKNVKSPENFLACPENFLRWPSPPPRRQHFREKFLSAPLSFEKCPSKPGPSPQLLDASYAPAKMQFISSFYLMNIVMSTGSILWRFQMNRHYGVQVLSLRLKKTVRMP